jgi:hypothetical protein
VYRLWRDGGYAIGALIAGVIADLLGVSWAIGSIAVLTFGSGLVVLIRMYETLPASAARSVATALVDGAMPEAPRPAKSRK